MARRSGAAWWVGLLALSTGGCGGASSSDGCAADQPAGFTCEQELSVEQSQCTGGANAAPLTPTVHWSSDGTALHIDAAAFRCAQSVCAYLDTTAATARVLLQPCDMNPSAPARCDCGYSLSVPVTLPASATRISVELRRDSIGGAQAAQVIGTLAVGRGGTLCDGSSALRFAASDGGGNLSGIPDLVLEVGWSFLLLDGQCRYYAMTAPDHEIRSGVLSEADAAGFSQDYLLGDWQTLEQPVSGCADASTQSFAFGKDRVQSSCEATPLTTANDTWLQRLYDAGSPVGGAVRYAVLSSSNDQWPASDPGSAMSYPLADPSSIVSAFGARADVHVAVSADASALRAVRSSYQAGKPPVPAPPYSVPVVVLGTDSVPAYFDLTLRDTVPFEKDGALDIASFIQ